MINGLKLFGLYLSMLGNVFSRPENKKIYIRRIVDEMIKLGVNSLTIVSIISLFMGAVVTIQTGLQLNNPFIPKYLIGYATRESLILEFSPTMIALILAGKVGSSIASEIGTMRVSEQIDIVVGVRFVVRDITSNNKLTQVCCLNVQRFGATPKIKKMS